MLARIINTEFSQSRHMEAPHEPPLKPPLEITNLTTVKVRLARVCGKCQSDWRAQEIGKSQIGSAPQITVRSAEVRLLSVRLAEKRSVGFI